MSLWQSTLYAESAGICHGVLRTADSENTPRIRFFPNVLYIFRYESCAHDSDPPQTHQAVQGEVGLEQESLEVLQCIKN